VTRRLCTQKLIPRELVSKNVKRCEGLTHPLIPSDGNFEKNESLAVTFAEKAAARQLPAAEFALGYFKLPSEPHRYHLDSAA
jgi:hypothetical protein